MMRITNLQHYLPLAVKWTRHFGLYRFPLPDLGEKIKEGKVKTMYVKQGDRVMEFEKIADVESDKQFTEITTPEEGIIKRLYYLEDQTCQVGDVFLDIETNTKQSQPQSPKQPRKVEETKPLPTKQHSEVKTGIPASATVNLWSRNHKVDLADVKGTGRKGRILKGDVILYLQNRKNTTLKGKTVQAGQPSPVLQVSKVVMDESEQLRQRLATYSASVPTLYLQELFDVTVLQLIVQQNQNNNQKISLLSLLIKTLSLALKANPKINSIYKADSPFNMNLAPKQNILLPFYKQNGLSFSAIDNLQSHSIKSIQQSLEKAQNGETSAAKIKEMIGKSTICLSYIGEVGALTMNPPMLGQTTCHASIGDVRDVAISIKGKPERRQFVSVVVGGDHRVIDGGSAARFTIQWKQLSQNPHSAFLNMI